MQPSKCSQEAWEAARVESVRNSSRPVLGIYVFALSVVSFSFFFSSLGGQGWAFSPNVTNPILRPCRAGEIITR